MIISKIASVVYSPFINNQRVNCSLHKFSSNSLNTISSDVFVKTPPSDVIFTSGKKNNTSEGAPLKQFDRLHDPYSGVPMITTATAAQIMEKIDSAKSAKEMLDVVAPYADCMHPVQQNMFYFTQKYIKNNPDKTLKDCLISQFPNALSKLRQKEKKILAEIYFYSKFITDASIRKELKKSLRSGMEKTDTDKYGNPKSTLPFKRKDLIKNFQLIKNSAQKKDKEVFEVMETLFCSLPQSRTDKDAFIVKYAQPGRYDPEIVKRFIIPSVMTMEHIRPDYNGGANNLKNFMGASELWNCFRGTTPLNKFVEIRPEIPVYCQLYADDIISLIKSGKFDGYEWYPYVLKDTLYTESKGSINIDVSDLELSQNQIKDGLALYEKDRKLRLTYFE